MDYLFALLLIVHLGAFGLGVSTTIVAPLVASRLSRLAPEGRAEMAPLLARLAINARAALAVLIASGVAMMYVRYGGFEGQGPWFWAKMAFVAAILLSLAMSLVLPRGTLDPKLMGWVTRLAMAGVVVAAVLAFN